MNKDGTESNNRLWQDCLFLSFAILLSLILYVGFLGFYSDDWSFLGYFSLSADRSLGGLIHSIYSSSIHQQLPSLPTGSTILLDGICPYVGRAIVFKSSWDLAGALWMIYRDDKLQADVITPQLTIEQDGISTLIYSIGGKYFYDRLLVYHFGRKTIHPITDPESAQLYFQTFPTNRDRDACPTGSAGFGVPIF